jgi:hypothetical protein
VEDADLVLVLVCQTNVTQRRRQTDERKSFESSNRKIDDGGNQTEAT